MKAILSAVYNYKEDHSQLRFQDEIESVEVTYTDGTSESLTVAEDIAMIGNIIFQQQRSPLK